MGFLLIFCDICICCICGLPHFSPRKYHFLLFLLHLQLNMRLLQHIVILGIVLLLAVVPMAAFGQESASESNKDNYPISTESVVLRKKGWWQDHSDYTTRFRVEQLVVPGALFLVGSLGIGENAPMRGINCAVRDGMTTIRNGRYLHFDDYMQYLPVAAYLGFCTTRRIEAKHTVPERIAVGVVAYISMTALTNGLKYSIREQRPDSGARNSFPSGHTATAFTGAELVRAEYGWGYGLAAYTVATGVAFMRLYNGRHWLNDVLAGAGIGILSARIGYWMLPLNRKIFKMDRRKALVTTPMYYPEQQALGMACAMSF